MRPGAEKPAAVLEAVAARLAHAMHESHAPVDRMGAALGRMMRALARSARALERLKAAGNAAQGSGAGDDERAAPTPLDDLEQCREALEREIAVCIESLQFHDRLMQHLAQVRGGLAATGGEPRQGSCEPRKPDLGSGTVELF
jgi:hypothetical protein